MEGGEIFVEIDSKKIQTGRTRFQGIRILLYAIMVMLGRLESQASCLFIAPGIAWYEQNRNTLDLIRSQRVIALAKAVQSLTFGSSSKPPSLCK